jgi:hypothetical protein
MNRLVETRKDIELLLKEGIVENRFNNTREGSDFLNKLADGAILDQDNFYFASLSEDLNAYYKTRWHKWKANLRQKYFRTPWAVVSIVAAIFLFILTIIQTRGMFCYGRCKRKMKSLSTSPLHCSYYICKLKDLWPKSQFVLYV